jgi:dTMP kinase
LFITFEGGEGTGKSTQVERLAVRLRSLGHACILTREPGGTPEAEAVRELLVTGDITRWSAEAEALLNYAARDSHLRKVIGPALDSGQTVICDRFIDSTMAYQCYAGGAPMDMVNALQAHVVGSRIPDLTLVFDLDPGIGLERARTRGDIRSDRFERKGLSYHQTLRQAFLTIANTNPARCTVIDAAGSIETVAQSVWQAVEVHLNG